MASRGHPLPGTALAYGDKDREFSRKTEKIKKTLTFFQIYENRGKQYPKTYSQPLLESKTKALKNSKQ